MYRAAPGVQTLRPVPVRQETAAFALTVALGPRGSLLVINRADVETRPFALTRSSDVADAVYFKLVLSAASDVLLVPAVAGQEVLPLGQDSAIGANGCDRGDEGTR